MVPIEQRHSVQPIPPTMDSDGSSPTIDDLVNLVDSLYSEKDPNKIVSIQSYLQGIQKSSSGLNLADLLLSTPGYSLNCKFFGALTYTVNLTLFQSDHSKIDIDSVLTRLLHHLKTSIHDYRFSGLSNLFIIKKLFNNLSKIFNSYTVSHKQWEDPLNALIQILISDQEPVLSAQIDYDQVLPGLIQDNVSLSLILDFATTIIEDLMKQSDSNAVEINETLQANIYPVIKFIVLLLFSGPKIESKVICLQHVSSWISYISYVEIATTIRYRDFNDILQYLMEFIQSSDDQLYESSVENLTQIYEGNPHLLNLDLRTKFTSLLSSDWSLNKIKGFFQAEDVDSLESFVILVIASLETDIVHLCTELFKAKDLPLLVLLLNLTNIPLIPIIEEEVSLKFISLWISIAETLTDEFDTIEARLRQDEFLIHEVKENSGNALLEVSKIYYKRIQIPISESSEYSKREAEFLNYRRDASELFDSISTIIGPSLYESLVKNIVEVSSIGDMEASLYLLSTISSNFSSTYDDAKVLGSLVTLFNSGFLDKFTRSCEGLGDLSRYYMKTSIVFLGSVNFFYKSRGSQYLDSVIGYLFNSLKNYSFFESVICRTIVDICDECREELSGSVAGFESILVEMINNTSVSPYTREKIIHSVGCIIQSITDPKTQATHLYNIIGLIDHASRPIISKNFDSVSKEEIEYVTSLFKSLKELAKALRIPDDMEDDKPELWSTFKSFYESYGNSIQTYSFQLITSFVSWSDNLSYFITISVEILQVGLLEDFGPFSFSSTPALEFAVSKLTDNILIISTLLDLLITTLNVGLRKSSPQHQKVSEETTSLVIRKFIVEIDGIIFGDPDLTQLSMNLFTTIVINRPSFLLHDSESFQFVVSKSLSLLSSSSERLVKKALLKFWTNLITVRNVSQDEAVAFQNFFNQDIGSALTYSVFSGLFASVRSDVDSYSSIIAILLARYQLNFKIWVKDALDRLELERTQKGMGEIQGKDFFIKQLLITRGSQRKCANLIKEFWAKVNGLISDKKIYSID